ncbi:MAG: hypothetical protein RLZZ347_452 [Candidatus Parcubacteria bacterium]|jgi:hypothetical protein
METKLLTVYIGDLLPGISPLPFLRPNLDPGSVVLNSFSEPDAFSFIDKPFFNIVSDPALAEYLLLPHNFFHVRNHGTILDHFSVLSRNLNKKILIFALGDLDTHVTMDNSIVFRTSQYRSRLQKNEVIIPAFVPDMLYGTVVTLRHKGAKPVVGFCGWAGFQTLGQRVRFVIKNTFLRSGFKKQGIYFRIKALASLRNTSFVDTNFLVRSSHFAHKKTRVGDPVLMRKEYIDNMLGSDFVLSPKGDGNYSVRFYEALSLGRIPLFIDTDTPLPFEKELRYDSFILRVDYRKIGELASLVSRFYAQMTDEQFVDMQKKAREAYEKSLSPEVSLRTIFSADFLSRYV